MAPKAFEDVGVACKRTRPTSCIAAEEQDIYVTLPVGLTTIPCAGVSELEMCCAYAMRRIRTDRASVDVEHRSRLPSQCEVAEEERACGLLCRKDDTPFQQCRWDCESGQGDVLMRWQKNMNQAGAGKWICADMDACRNAKLFELVAYRLGQLDKELILTVCKRECDLGYGPRLYLCH